MHGSQPYESAVEKQIRLAVERGEFDDLPGKGKPLPNLADTSEDWWVRGYVRREGIESDALLPTPLRLRKEIEALPETVRGLPDEAAVRDVVAELNRRVVAWLRNPDGPRVPVRRADPEAVVATWREQCARRAEELHRIRAEQVPPPRRRWWSRRARS